MFVGNCTIVGCDGNCYESCWGGAGVKVNGSCQSNECEIVSGMNEVETMCTALGPIVGCTFYPPWSCRTTGCAGSGKVGCDGVSYAECALLYLHKSQDGFL